ncbi:uncharacterized protein LOC141613067 [Silene latifolia]|uniref:uncharacterized protein LOC141613067 n=1 Tax=Silene latifolia TaxID=37657 RepID=UPI003D7836FD
MKTKNLDNLERSRIIQVLLEKSINGKPKYGAMSEVASQFGVCRKTITDIWNEGNRQRQAGQVINVNSKLKGRKLKSKLHFDAEKLESIDLLKRTTQQEVADGMGVSQSTINRWVAEDHINSHTNAIKPGLTDPNKLDRLIYCLQHLQYGQVSKKFTFKDQSNVVHMDEKWFFITKPSQRFYVGKREKRPYRTCQSKRFITKVMFMCAVSRPKYGPNKEVICDGKLGLWPFVMEVPAKRKSKNRCAGTMETKCIESINKQVTKEMVINKVLPAIKAKWPSNYSKNIMIQQDNVRPHITNKDADFKRAATEDEWNIEFSYQPPNSPDLNVLDLGFFRAIQSLQQKKKSKVVSELVENTTKAFDDLEVIKLNYVFITLQACMLEIMQLKGGNDYPVPHMHKSKLAKNLVYYPSSDSGSATIDQAGSDNDPTGRCKEASMQVEDFEEAEQASDNKHILKKHNNHQTTSTF